MNGWITVKVYSNRPEAEVGGALLRANNIKFQVLADDAGGAYPFPMQPSFGVQLQVLGKDKEKALSLLSEKG